MSIEPRGSAAALDHGITMALPMISRALIARSASTRALERIGGVDRRRDLALFVEPHEVALERALGLVLAAREHAPLNAHDVDLLEEREVERELGDRAAREAHDDQPSSRCERAG
jgi:aromatic ring-opening dioxygenase LigB subunit